MGWGPPPSDAKSQPAACWHLGPRLPAAATRPQLAVSRARRLPAAAAGCTRTLAPGRSGRPAELRPPPALALTPAALPLLLAPPSTATGGCE